MTMDARELAHTILDMALAQSRSGAKPDDTLQALIEAICEAVWEQMEYWEDFEE